MNDIHMDDMDMDMDMDDGHGHAHAHADMATYAMALRIWHGSYVALVCARDDHVPITEDLVRGGAEPDGLLPRAHPPFNGLARAQTGHLDLLDEQTDPAVHQLRRPPLRS